MKRWLLYFIFILAPIIPGTIFTDSLALAETCETVVKKLNQALQSKIDEEELIFIIRTLNDSNNQKLPPKFVTKSQARGKGWKPGRNLWDYKNLAGKSIGGDIFTNREGKLPNKKRWREADLDYKGGHRGPKRIVYSDDGLRMITVDHYSTFKELAACQ
jgi:ribonuclease T1